MAIEIPNRWVTTAARRVLARRFDLRDDPFSQDWAWEVADPSRFGEFLDAYVSGSLDEDERFVLRRIPIAVLREGMPEVRLVEGDGVVGLSGRHEREAVCRIVLVPKLQLGNAIVFEAPLRLCRTASNSDVEPLRSYDMIQPWQSLRFRWMK